MNCALCHFCESICTPDSMSGLNSTYVGGDTTRPCVCGVCRLIVVWVDCRCFLSFVILGGARHLELSPCSSPRPYSMYPAGGRGRQHGTRSYRRNELHAGIADAQIVHINDTDQIMMRTFFCYFGKDAVDSALANLTC